MRRKVSQAFLNASHRKKFENHWRKGRELSNFLGDLSVDNVFKMFDDVFRIAEKHHQHFLIKSSKDHAYFLTH